MLKDKLFLKNATHAMIIFTIAVFLLGSVGFGNEILKAQKEVAFGQKKVATVTAQQVDFFIQNLADNLKWVAASPELLSGDPAAERYALKKYFNSGMFDGVYITDSTGRIIEGYPQIPDYLKPAVQDSTTTANGDKPKIYRFKTGSAQEAVMCFSRILEPARGDKLYLKAVVDLNRNSTMSLVSKSLQRDRWGEGYLVDSSGKPLICRGEGCGRRISTGMQQLMKEGHGEISRNGVKYLATFQKAAGSELGVLVEIPKNQVFQPAVDFGKIMMAIILPGWLIVMLLTLRWLAKLVEPMHRLRESLVEVAAGNYNVSINLNESDEYLARAFNVMIDKVRQTREHEIQVLQDRFLSDKFSAIGDVASGAAHEIRNPLTSIKGFTQLLQSHFSEGERCWEYAEIIKKDIKQIEDIINRFLLMAAPTFPMFRRIDIHELLDEVLKTLVMQAVTNEVTIKTDFAETMDVDVDFLQMKQLIRNLCENAIQAMPHGGRLIIKTRCNWEAQKATIIISDTGEGIPPAHLDRVADPFFSTKENGTGLGLTVSYRIVQNHRGLFRIISKEDCGTTCIIELPLTQANSAVGSSIPGFSQ